MKRLIILLAFLALTSPVFAAENTKCTNPKSIAIVDGMVCDFCAQAMIKTFKNKNKNVTDVKIDLTTKEVAIDTKPGTSISDEEINKLVDYSGYKLVKVEHACKKS